MIYINHPDIENYIKELIDVDDIILEMEEKAKSENFPIVDRIVGKFLYFITVLKSPKIVVELGSGFGYSAYWFAKGLKDGRVVLTDYKEENIKTAKEYFKRGNLIDKAIFKIGDGIEIAKEFKNIDILFLDLEKSRYIEAVKSLKDNLSSDGLIIADNVLWYGKVLEKNPDKKTEKIKKFTKYMFDNFDTTILPIRDGVLISKVKS
ncbi:MAG: O-methyltransferase [Persephonella sp.]|nr:MAG: O-methyltransferase [Persephonella sp.]